MAASTDSSPRVLIISHQYPSEQDPTPGIFIHRHVQALNKLGMNYRIVSPLPWAPKILWVNPRWRYYGTIPNEEVFEGISVRRVPYVVIPFKPYYPYLGLSMALSLIPTLKKIRNEFYFDLIHCHTVTPDGLASIKLGKYFDVPTICTARGSDLYEYVHRSKQYFNLSIQVLKKSSTLICLTNKLASYAIKLTDGVVKPKMIYNGVDQEMFFPIEDNVNLRDELNLPKGRRLLCFVGRIEPEKGIRELYEAFRRVALLIKDVDLVCVGVGPWEKCMREKMLKDNLDSRIFLPGKVTHTQVAKYMQASNVYVFPSYNEGMPNSLLEAMACGLPCIASDVGGIPEAIDHGMNGLLLRPHDTEQLTTLLLNVLEEPDLASKLGMMASKTILKKFSWPNNAVQHAVVYEETLTNFASKKTRKKGV